MFLKASEIDACVEWLMSKASDPVRYLAARDLVRLPKGARELAMLKRKMEASLDAREILGAQKPDGSWFSGGAWATKPPYEQKGRKGGYDPDSPKYVTANWVLPLLCDMGFTAENERVKKACDYILDYPGFQDRYRIFNDPSFPPGTGSGDLCCRFFQSLAALGKAGMGGDPRVKRGYEALLAGQREDGGWVSDHCVSGNGWTRSCPFSSYHAALALYSSGAAAHLSPLKRALAFLLGHLSEKREEDIRRFFFHGHSVVHELLMASELKTGMSTKAARVAMDWLLEQYLPDEGHFAHRGKPVSRYRRREDGMDPRVAKYRLYHLAEDDWLTYYAARIGRNLSPA
jgi:hypothetical protein